DGPTNVHPPVAAIGPTQFRKRLCERGEARLPRGIVFIARHEHAECAARGRPAAAASGHAAAPASATTNLRRAIGTVIGPAPSGLNPGQRDDTMFWRLHEPAHTTAVTAGRLLWVMRSYAPYQVLCAPHPVHSPNTTELDVT